MNRLSISCNIFFGNSYWIGVFERVEDGKLSAVKVTFGKEPNDKEVYEYIINHYTKFNFGSSVTTKKKVKIKNPKRLQRAVKKSCNKTFSSKSQQALKLQFEEYKKERKKNCSIQREERKKYLFELKKLKRKRKHRGK
ncbi:MULTISPECIES: YjdF family protein [Gemella]|uniref:YjdF family protein n=1 Tax=Gemella TaxID=1378 RepID=UPI000767EEFF|nr:MULTISPECIES: YjdF family protein [Gemella]AME09108.1 hypothetical protein AXE85_02490 [Gemella sp. oral taxon 928]AXI26680.1 DUF2992 domain-containing protein [Gemella sp. ND 6198]